MVCCYAVGDVVTGLNQLAVAMAHGEIAQSITGCAPAKGWRCPRALDRGRLKPRSRGGGAGLLTTGALFAGFYAVVAAMDVNSEKAAVAIFVAMFLDGLDGRVARLTSTESDFGKEYDSLVDMVSFGLAPAVGILCTSSPIFGERRHGASSSEPSMTISELIAVTTAVRRGVESSTCCAGMLHDHKSAPATMMSARNCLSR